MALGKILKGRWRRNSTRSNQGGQSPHSRHSPDSIWLGEITASVAHEIRSPLTVLLTKCEQVHKQACALELVGLATYGKQELRQDLDTIIRMARRIETLTRTLGGLVRSSHGEQNAVVGPLCAVIEESKVLWQERVKSQGVELEIELKENPKVWGDVGQLSQVVTNLMNNSLDAVHGMKNPWIKIHAVQKTEVVTIKVMDNGPGMPLVEASDRKRSYRSTKHNGYGLGLSIAKGIVENFHGQLCLDHASECTCFVVILPAVNPLTNPKVLF